MVPRINLENMKQVITSERLPIKVWTDFVEPEALEQAKHLANLPFAENWVSLMPDTHLGFGMPIGGVLATVGVVVPNAVGVDIGCGMGAVKASLNELETEKLKEIMGEIRKVVPVGFAHQKEKQEGSLMPEADTMSMLIVGNEYEKALTQIGTLGGGNHFIEIQKGDDNHIWLMLHSGSRNLGLQVAKHYNEKAVEINEKYHSSVLKEWELAFLPLDSEEGQNYLDEMQYCVDFALANRKLMMARVMEIVGEKTGASFEPMINIAHNYAVMENHKGKNLLIHRKGATKASKGLIGIIPGSMGTASYIVEGLGNEESFESCSHGSGRKMGRKMAQKTLDLADEQKKMQGILGAPRNQEELEEAPGAYKDIEAVMQNQIDLVKPIVKLRPIGVIKG